MSHLEYFSYPGFGEHMRETLSYSQAVRIGDRIEISGQGMLSTTHDLSLHNIGHS
jgi:enamine deaminase RidA (YjgF/YER057c/UK114 family)